MVMELEVEAATSAFAMGLAVKSFGTHGGILLMGSRGSSG